ncbi:CinA family protein [Microbacterium profundi]|uniref:CinA family protein n=1 Tax=Microbacterium profundi TaxID=450380 RepID=A0ABV3LGD7_9MICO|nr:CinA family protein [Microbacterium profundi]MCE7482970.1 CinA family protein [Microbacterium profundi]
MQLSDEIDRLSRVAIADALRVAVVESLTAGGLAHAIGAGDDASSWFAGGIVAYMTDVKQHLLNVSAGVDPCSAECAEQLAVGGLELFGGDVCVATTGVGGPDPEDGHPPGTVYLGWAMHDQRGHEHLQFEGDPDAVLSATVEAGVRLLRERTEDFSDHHPT